MVLNVHTKRVVHGQQILFRDLAVVILVDEIERLRFESEWAVGIMVDLLELLNLLWGEHGKYIGGGTLGAFLLGLASSLGSPMSDSEHNKCTS